MAKVVVELAQRFKGLTVREQYLVKMLKLKTTVSLPYGHREQTSRRDARRAMSSDEIAARLRSLLKSNLVESLEQYQKMCRKSAKSKKDADAMMKLFVTTMSLYYVPSRVERAALVLRLKQHVLNSSEKKLRRELLLESL